MAKTTQDNLEPACFNGVIGLELQVQASIAISLKRIADSLDNNSSGNYNLYDMIQKIANNA